MGRPIRLPWHRNRVGIAFGLHVGQAVGDDFDVESQRAVLVRFVAGKDIKSLLHHGLVVHQQDFQRERVGLFAVKTKSIKYA